MDEIEKKVQLLREKYPIVPYTCASQLFTTVRRMRAEKKFGIPVIRRTNSVISVDDGKPANQLDEAAWESFYMKLCEELQRRYPDLYEALFPAGDRVLNDSIDDD